MDTKHLRRLGIKEQSLQSEASKISQELQSSAKGLQELKRARIDAEKNWKQELHKAMDQNKLCSSREQNFFLSNSVHRLKKLNGELQKHSIKEKEQLSKLQKTISQYKKTEKQLEACKSKKEAIESGARAIREQAEADELSILKYSQAENFTKINERDLLPDYLLATTELKNMPVQMSDCRPKPQVSTDEKKVGIASSDRLLSQYQAVEEGNRALKVNCVQSAAGTHLSVDYLVRPGHLLSVQAFKANQVKPLEVQIESSSSEDRAKLLNSRESLEKVSKARVKII